MPRRKAEAQAADAQATDTRADDDALLSLLAAGLRLQAVDDRWRVSGNTLPHRTLLRDCGGTWNKLDQCWEFSGEDPTTRLAAALAAMPPSPGHNSGETAPEKPHYWGRSEEHTSELQSQFHLVCRLLHEQKK